MQRLKLLSIVTFCAVMGSNRVEAVTGFSVFYQYRTTTNGQTHSGYWNYATGKYSASENCPLNHRTPDGQLYEHEHTHEAFPFSVYDYETGDLDWVTAVESDWAWDAWYLTGANWWMVSGSTFLGNCYSYATSAPTWMESSGWTAWTDASSQCESTSKSKSYQTKDHCVAVTGIQTYEDGSCNVTGTSEKNGSSGVYSACYIGMGTAGNPADGTSFRKRK